MKIVFLDRSSIGSDIDLQKFEKLGEVVNYDFTYPEEVPDRAEDADILIVNKTLINEKTIGKAKNLKLVCVTATGTNNLDKEYLAKRKIEWRNVAGYSTETVAQHTFALALYLLEHLPYYDEYVSSGAYMGDRSFTHFAKNFHELSSLNWGIIGLGTIGKRVAQIASCFGCRVQYFSTSGHNHDDTYDEVDFDSLLKTSDIISIHAPLNEATENLIDKDALSKMKPTAILLNLGRGPIVDEKALADAIKNHTIGGAGLDVLSVEPMSKENPLSEVMDDERIIITPHIAWASVEARVRLMDIIYHQVEEYLAEHGK